MTIARRLAALEARLGVNDEDDAALRVYREFESRGEKPPPEVISAMMLAALKRYGLAALCTKSWELEDRLKEQEKNRGDE